MILRYSLHKNVHLGCKTLVLAHLDKSTVSYCCHLDVGMGVDVTRQR